MKRTELSLFVQGFQGALTPLLAEMRSVLAHLGAIPGTAPLPFEVPDLEDGLRDAARELEELGTRVASERARVFVFGPAKAGKSALLDALAGVRAWEVSILPTYPCLRRVCHAGEEGLTLTRFDGEAESLTDPTALASRLQRLHGELARTACELRERGAAFDPPRHLPSAVRRIERRLPAELLARTSVELVECPPIHGPLFASYDSMLIGEPDAARAAVFVVRAAQLCDDSVFDGIEELLLAFERPLLVVNLDEKSRELSRAGELAIGLERDDPSRLIEAFENTTTCEPLARALREERVRVLALDLLEVARARVHGEEEGAPSGSSRSRFTDLLSELAGALDGHEALRTLVDSALRHANEVLGEARALLEHDSLAGLPRALARADEEAAALELERAALVRLGERSPTLWAAEEAFLDLAQRLGTRLGARARELAQELAPALGAALEDWFASDESLQQLLEARLAPRLAEAEAELRRSGERLLGEDLSGLAALARLSEGVRRDLSEARLELAALIPALPALAVRAAQESAVRPSRPLDVEAISVRPRFRERLFLRKEAELRRALLGPAAAPARALSTEEKERRLGRDTLASMRRGAEARALSNLEERARAHARRLFEAFLDTLHERCGASVREALLRLEKPIEEHTTRARELRRVHEALQSLEHALSVASAALDEFVGRFRPQGTLVPARRAPPAAAEGSERESARRFRGGSGPGPRTEEERQEAAELGAE